MMYLRIGVGLNVKCLSKHYLNDYLNDHIEYHTQNVFSQAVFDINSFIYEL